MKYNIKDILEENIEKYGDNEYIFEKIESEYRPNTYRKFYYDVLKVASLLQKRHKIDDKIIICAENSYNYMVADAAIMGYTCVSATLSKEWGEYDLSNAIEIIKPVTFIYSNSKKEIVNELMKKYTEIEYLEIENIIPESLGDIDMERIDGTNPSKLIFSSGTTGMPKGVLLSQENMFACYDSLTRRAYMDSDDIDYLFLPLSHTYASIWNFMISLINGMKIYLCSNTKLMFQEILEVKPTIFCAVPLIYERLYAVCLEKNINPEILLGGKIRFSFSGGARLKPEIRRFMKEHKINFLEAYGMTETSSLISVEYPNWDDYESVGTILENIECMIDNPDQDGIGEIILKGENVFSGYYKNDYQTDKVFDENKYFHTGDLGKIVGNKLYVSGRKKRVIIFSNGENIYPDDIEEMFNDSNITKVKVFDKEGIIFASIYVKEYKDYGEYIVGINKKLPAFSHIKGYEVIIDNIEARQK